MSIQWAQENQLRITPADFDEITGNSLTALRIWFDPVDPQPQQIRLEDIAHALARICRYGGQLKNFYSVAEHSIYVAHQLYRTTGDKQLALSGLMHDATEAYLGDVIRPVKRLLSDYPALESKLADVIYDRFKLTIPTTHPWIKDADNAILPWEMAMFRMSKVRPAADHDHVMGMFMGTFQHYANQEQNMLTGSRWSTRKKLNP